MRRPGEEQEKRVPTRLGSRFRWGPRCRADGATRCALTAGRALCEQKNHFSQLSYTVRVSVLVCAGRAPRRRRRADELSLPRDARDPTHVRLQRQSAAAHHLRTCHLHLRSPLPLGGGRRGAGGGRG